MEQRYPRPMPDGDEASYRPGSSYWVGLLQQGYSLLNPEAHTLLGVPLVHKMCNTPLTVGLRLGSTDLVLMCLPCNLTFPPEHPTRLTINPHLWKLQE